MAAVGGAPVEISFAGRLFTATADSDASRKLGGFTVEEESNGNGSTRTIKTRVTWEVSGFNIVIDDDRGDQEFLQDKIDEASGYDFTISYPSGITYQGKGNLTGDLAGSSQSASTPVSFKGGGKLTKQ